MSETLRRMMKVLSLVVITAVVVVCDIPIITDSYEPNDSFEEARAISLGSQIRATIEPSGDLDYFRFTVSGSGDIKLVYRLTVPSALRPEVFFYDAAQGEIYRNHSSIAGDMLCDSLNVLPGDYFVRITSFSFEESDSSYILTVTAGAPALAGNVEKKYGRGERG